jgi:hypothetical protein
LTACQKKNCLLVSKALCHRKKVTITKIFLP